MKFVRRFAYVVCNKGLRPTALLLALALLFSRASADTNTLHPGGAWFDGAFAPGEFSPNFNDAVLSIADHDGAVFVGGRFEIGPHGYGIGLSQWDGSTWSGMAGIYAWRDVPEVAAMRWFDGSIYCAGHFLSLWSGIPAQNIAKWDGTAWADIGGLSSPDVAHGYALSVYQDDLYVGGHFTDAGSTASPGVARWTGEQWEPVGTGVNATVFALSVFDSFLVAGGDFTHAGDSSAAHVARWDGKAWHPLGEGVPGRVMSLAEFNGGLFAGGSFTGAGETAASYIARWNGSAWSDVSGGTDGPIFALAVYQGALVAGGWFDRAGGVSVRNIARWDGAKWSDVGGGTDYSVNALCASGTRLFAGGFFTKAGGSGASRIAMWDGTQWGKMTSGFDGEILDYAAHGDTLVAAGGFSTAGESSACRIAIQDASGTWQPLGDGMSKPSVAGAFGDPARVRALAFYGGDLYAGGDFEKAGNASARNLARWDGAQWHTVANVDGLVTALSEWNGRLFMGGAFHTIDDVPMNLLGQWNGVSWESVGGGVDGVVLALRGIGDDLAVTGVFTRVGMQPAAGVALWSGTMWTPLTSDMGENYDVRDAVEFQGDLMITGSFTHVDGTDASHIARWNGTGWWPLDTGLNARGFALAVYEGELYVGGYFTRAGGVVSPNIARWNGSTWGPVSTGMNEVVGTGDVSTLEVLGESLYVGGRFSVAGDVLSGFGARWVLDESPDIVVSNYSADWTGHAVSVEWSLTGDPGAVEVAVFRTDDKWIQAPMPDVDIRRDGNTFSFRDSSVETAQTYTYLVVILSGGAELDRFEVSVDVPAAVPAYGLAIRRVYPNPMRSSGMLRFETPNASRVQAQLFDVQGRHVASIMERRFSAGVHDLPVDVSALPSGVYFIQLRVGEHILSDRLVVAR